MRRLRGGAALVLLALTGCDALLVEPQGSGASLQLAMQVAPGPDASGVVARVDQVRVWFRTAESERDTVVPVRTVEGVMAARLHLHPTEMAELLELEAALLVETFPIFRGEAQLQPQDWVSNDVTLEVTPTALHLFRPFDFDSLSVLGSTFQLDGAVSFATGDPFPGASPTWISEDPTVVEVSGGRTATTRGNGRVRLVGRYADSERGYFLIVAQEPQLFLGVDASALTVTAGDTVRVFGYGSDTTGAPLQPGARIAWSVQGPAIVTRWGEVVTQGTGTVVATGTAAGNTFQVSITVQ